MALDKNYSTINELNKIFSINENYRYFSRTIVQIDYPNYQQGITSGDVIRYDPSNFSYVKSFANSSINSEVFGIVESVSSDGTLNVVTNGSIILNPEKTINVTGTNSGGNDIYFLSGISAGFIQNYGPTYADYIIKPIYQVGPHGNYTGIVRNYIGYKNPAIQTQQNQVLVAISDDGTKSLFYIENTKRFILYSLIYSGSQILKSPIINFEKPTAVEFSLIPNIEIKISNDGNHFLILNKTSKKISYCFLEQASLVLKQQINLDITGNSEDLLWAADDELTSFTLSTRSLNTIPNPLCFNITSHDACSRILYYKRNVNSRSPYKWKKIYENIAFGFCDYAPIPQHSRLSDDEYENESGIYRTCDVSCKGKNYAISTFCLNQDQRDFSSKTSGQYVKYQNLLLNPTITTSNGGSMIKGITANSIGSIDLTIKSSFFDINLVPSDYEDHTNRHFKCNFGIKNYRIHNKIGDYYYQDFSSAETGGLRFYRPLQQSSALTSNSLLTNEILTLNLLSSKGREFNSGESITALPIYAQNALWSSTSSTDTFFIFALLYQYVLTANGSSKNNLVIIKFPFNSYDNKNVFRYFMESSYYSSAVPDGIVPELSDNGLVSNFVTTPSTPIVNNYATASMTQTTSGSVESPTLINETTITSIDINQLRSFKIFTSNSRYFLCTEDKVLVWTYSSSTYVVINMNLKDAKFYNLASGEYFHKDNMYYYYNSSTQAFVAATI